MAKRRKPKNKTDIPRIEGVPYHDAWTSYSCISCGMRNYEQVGQELVTPQQALEDSSWLCFYCNFNHSQFSDLPFLDWPAEATQHGSVPTDRFWKAFFLSCTESPSAFWKQCNTCERILPNADFSRHVNWGPLEKQMECRACKAVINANLNPKRTTEQLRESSLKRRIADLLTSQANEKLNVSELFERFESKCFKTGTPLDIKQGGTWQIDHTLPSRCFYPLTKQNATLLSTAANQKKAGLWPSEFYENNELVQLAKLTGAPLELLASSVAIMNANIDVNACVDKFLSVRSGSNLQKRVTELKLLLDKHELANQLSDKNKALLRID